MTHPFFNLDISKKWITTVVDKISASGSVELDQRGRHARKKTSQQLDTDGSVFDHIKMFPRIESHYLRKSNTKEYLSGELSVAEMYRQYLKWVAQEKGSSFLVASKRRYETILNSSFNISFYVPKKDRCNLCESFKNTNCNRDNGNYKKHLDDAANSQIMKGSFSLNIDFYKIIYL